MKGFFRLGNPFVEIVINGHSIKVILDTGFNSEIMLPQLVIEKLHLPKIGDTDYVTATGEGEKAFVYEGIIDFFGEKKDIFVISTDAPFALAGMELFHECRIILEMHKDLVEVTKTA